LIVAEMLLVVGAVTFWMRKEYRKRGSLFVAPSVLDIQESVVTVVPVGKTAEFHSPEYQTVDGASVAFVSVQSRSSSLARHILAAARCLIFIWYLVVQITQYKEMTEGHHVFWSLSFFTVWNYHIQIVCWFFMALCSVLKNPGPKLRGCAGCLFELCLPMSILVAAVLWGILMPSSNSPDTYVNFGSLNQHLINTLLFLGEFAFNRLVVRLDHIILVLMWPAVYMLFIWIQHAYSGLDWPYFFLNLTDAAPLWYGLLVIFHMLVYVAVCWVSSIKARKWGLVSSHPELETSILNEETQQPTRGF